MYFSGRMDSIAAAAEARVEEEQSIISAVQPQFGQKQPQLRSKYFEIATMLKSANIGFFHLCLIKIFFT